MSVNKVDVNGVTVLDLTQDSVTPATLKKGETAHDASGAAIVGEMESSAPNLQSKSVTYTANGTATITPDEGYDGLSSVDVTVNVSGGYNLKKVTYEASANKQLTDVTITHNCGSIPKFVIVRSNNSNSSYLMGGFGTNESQTSSFLMMINNTKVRASVTSTTFTYISTSMRYYGGSTYTYYFFY